MWHCAECDQPITDHKRGILTADKDLTNWRVVHKIVCDPHTGPWHDLWMFAGPHGLRGFQLMQRDGAFKRLSSDELIELRAEVVRENYRIPVAPPRHKPTKAQASGLKLRFRIFKRDNYRCQLCGRSAQDGVTLEVDHKIARAQNGTDHPDNLWTLCFDCNRGKSDESL